MGLVLLACVYVSLCFWFLFYVVGAYWSPTLEACWRSSRFAEALLLPVLMYALQALAPFTVEARRARSSPSSGSNLSGFQSQLDVFLWCKGLVLICCVVLALNSSTLASVLPDLLPSEVYDPVQKPDQPALIAYKQRIKDSLVRPLPPQGILLLLSTLTEIFAVPGSSRRVRKLDSQRVDSGGCYHDCAVVQGRANGWQRQYASDVDDADKHKDALFVPSAIRLMFASISGGWRVGPGSVRIRTAPSCSPSFLDALLARLAGLMIAWGWKPYHHTIVMGASYCTSALALFLLSLATIADPAQPSSTEYTVVNTRDDDRDERGGGGGGGGSREVSPSPGFRGGDGLGPIPEGSSARDEQVRSVIRPQPNW
eukprot:1328353-Rhodomonas_salina.6